MKQQQAKKIALDNQQLLFAYHLARLGDALEAARLAEYKDPAGEAARLLQNQEVQALAALFRSLAGEQGALPGLRRLAYGGIGDAVALCLAEDTGQTVNPGELDLYNVSELRRPKGGGWELKFHSRLDALRLLLEHGESGDGGGGSGLLQALENSAKALRED